MKERWDTLLFPHRTLAAENLHKIRPDYYLFIMGPKDVTTVFSRGHNLQIDRFGQPTEGKADFPFSIS